MRISTDGFCMDDFGMVPNRREPSRFFVYKYWFREMFEKADAIPEKYVHAFSEILKDMGKSISEMEKSE